MRAAPPRAPRSTSWPQPSASGANSGAGFWKRVSGQVGLAVPHPVLAGALAGLRLEVEQLRPVLHQPVDGRLHLLEQPRLGLRAGRLRVALADRAAVGAGLLVATRGGRGDRRGSDRRGRRLDGQRAAAAGDRDQGQGHDGAARERPTHERHPQPSSREPPARRGEGKEAERKTRAVYPAPRRWDKAGGRRDTVFDNRAAPPRAMAQGFTARQVTDITTPSSSSRRTPHRSRSDCPPSAATRASEAA
jgi:hypothetical protein